MIIIILTVLAGCVPSLLVFFWLRGYLHKENALYKTNCNRMLTAGLLTIFPVLLLSVCMVVVLHLSGVKASHPLLYAALFTFGTYALSEELSKFYMFRRRLKILEGEHSWLDLIVYSTTIVGVIIAFVLHGLYDFSLTEELQAVSDDLAAAIAFPMALLEVIIIIVLIVFIRRHKNDPKYTAPLIPEGFRAWYAQHKEEFTR